MSLINLIYSFLIFLNVFLLAILVPGGPIENRDFSKMRGVSFWGFNVFLISLGVSSFIASYLLLVGSAIGVYLGVILGVLYLVVYVIDLAGFYPKSPTKMSNQLMFFEILNACLAIYTVIVFVSIL
ncbi:hypothetical protein ACM26V_06815 [Salipaludibacillus sp. HK11]|uniref:hypothetical protein n=1 Tax=Salipaludibacillus sp. HK11 TaxID=3394320 RepID=UPI0039FC8ED4